MPRTVLEAYAAGVPVIGAASGLIPGLIGRDDLDWLFPPGDDVSLAERMVALIARGRQALPRREDFVYVLEATQPAQVAERYLALYEEVQACRAGAEALTPAVA